MSDFDTIIKGGTIIDGTRHRERFVGDIGIKDGLIAEIAVDGLDAGRADKVIEAAGMNVVPGYVDLHTHYDGQLLWDPYLSCSSWHGAIFFLTGLKSPDDDC